MKCEAVALRLHLPLRWPQKIRLHLMSGAAPHVPIGAGTRAAAGATTIHGSTGAGGRGCLPPTRSSWAFDRCRQPRRKSSSAVRRPSRP